MGGDAHGEEQHVPAVVVRLRAVDGDDLLVERRRETGRDDHVGKVDQEAGHQHDHDEHAHRRQRDGEPGTTPSGRRRRLPRRFGPFGEVAGAGGAGVAVVHRTPNRYRGRIARTPDTQPATPPAFYGARQRQHFTLRLARRGWALVRTAVLVFVTGLLVAMVIATLFGALVIAINGKLP